MIFGQPSDYLGRGCLLGKVQVKRECGFAQRDALELYPSDRTYENTANLRHLWLVTEHRSPLNWQQP